MAVDRNAAREALEAYFQAEDSATAVAAQVTQAEESLASMQQHRAAAQDAVGAAKQKIVAALG